MLKSDVGKRQPHTRQEIINAAIDVWESYDQSVFHPFILHWPIYLQACINTGGGRIYHTDVKAVERQELPPVYQYIFDIVQ